MIRSFRPKVRKLKTNSSAVSARRTGWPRKKVTPGRRPRHRPVRSPSAPAGRARNRTKAVHSADTPKLAAFTPTAAARPVQAAPLPAPHAPRTPAAAPRAQSPARPRGRVQPPVGLGQLPGPDETPYDGGVADGEQRADGLAQ